jgi:hypothetical protein
MRYCFSLPIILGIFSTSLSLPRINAATWIGFGQIEIYASPDKGETWFRSIVQPDETLSVGGNTGIINQGSQPAVGPDGTLYVAWERGWLSPFFGQAGAGVYPQIRVASSHDSGRIWSAFADGFPPPGGNPAGRLVSDICSGSLFPPAGYNRADSNDFPRIAVARGGPNRGAVTQRKFIVIGIGVECGTGNRLVLFLPP